MAAELILASASPRRSELLAALGLPFRCVPASIDEASAPQEAPEALCCRLSLEKAQAILRDFPDATVIGADTIVVLDGMILGKPTSPADAIAMLRALRGRPHEVLSAVSVCQTGAPPRQHLERSKVWMRAYTEAEIQAYVASGDPLDKAGAYAIQHPGFHPVTLGRMLREHRRVAFGGDRSLAGPCWLAIPCCGGGSLPPRDGSRLLSVG